MSEHPELQASPEQMKRALAQAIQREVAGGWRVESQSDINAILVKGGATNHTLHLIISLLTCGLWLFVWPVVWLINKPKRLILNVDDYGNVLRQDAA